MYGVSLFGGTCIQMEGVGATYKKCFPAIRGSNFVAVQYRPRYYNPPLPISPEE
jgi:hypothetical protein